MTRTLIFIFMWFLPTAITQTLQWQATEIIGATANQKQWIQNHLEFNHNAVSEDQISLQGAAACKRVKKQFGEHIRCEVVAYPDGNIHFVLNMQSDNSPDFINLRKMATTKSGMKEADTVLQCIPNCSDPAIRIKAWDEAKIKYSLQKVCEIAADFLFDSSVELRNMAAQYINHQFTTCSNVLHAERLAQQLNLMLYRPFHTDRNKSIATLALLLPILSDCMVVKLRVDWQWLAEQSILPNVGGIAKQLLQQSSSRQCLKKDTE
ncbi:MAG: hypothetical protein KKA56_05425 [Gammaproteobacteria bacterium]|nr:hypothetical protein [Gammaproteobacteria bacterium]